MDPATLRDGMVDGLAHESKGVISSESVAMAMRTVPREEFVPDEATAYEDRPHRFGGATVLSPSLAARLLEALSLRTGDRVLIVGAGVGYTAALAAEIVGPTRVHALDIDPRQVRTARSNLRGAGYGAVLVDRGDGGQGLEPYAPFDRILIEAAVSRPPAPLCRQLRDGGRLVAPILGDPQELRAFAGPDPVERLGPVRFRPLLHSKERPSDRPHNRMRREDREFAQRDARARAGWEHEWIDWDRM